MDQRLKEHPDECEEGFLGSFYRGDRYVDKAIIFVGGSGETRRIVEARAAILAREGYSVLAVGYYLWKPLSKQTVAIPLDYVERAIYEKGSHLLGMPDEALDAMGDRDKF